MGSCKTWSFVHLAFNPILPYVIYGHDVLHCVVITYCVPVFSPHRAYVLPSQGGTPIGCDASSTLSLVFLNQLLLIFSPNTKRICLHQLPKEGHTALPPCCGVASSLSLLSSITCHSRYSILVAHFRCWDFTAPVSTLSNFQECSLEAYLLVLATELRITLNCRQALANWRWDGLSTQWPLMIHSSLYDLEK